MSEMRNEQYTIRLARRASALAISERCKGNKAECVRQRPSSGSFAGLPEYRLMGPARAPKLFAHRGFAAIAAGTTR